MPVPPMATVETDRITGQQLAHTGSQWPFFRLAQQVKMIGKESPGINIQRSILSQFGQTNQKIISISIVVKNLSFLDPPTYDMMQRSQGIQSG